MSLSSRWSLFSRSGGVKEEDESGKSGKSVYNDDNDNNDNNDNNNGGEEIVFSVVTKEEGVVTKHEDGEQEAEAVAVVVAVVVAETRCNNENGVNENADTNGSIYEKAAHVHFKMQTDRNHDISNNNSSHYKGLHTELMPTIPVLFIEEFVPPSWVGSKKSSVSLTDWRAYVYYDSYRGAYVLNGTRRRDNEQGSGRYPDIRMTFKSRSSLAFYLRQSMCSSTHNLSVTMYSMYRNVVHLSTCGAMPSFHSIHHCRGKFRTELFGYDDCRLSLKKIESYLKVVKEGEDNGYLFRPTNLSG